MPNLLYLFESCGYLPRNLWVVGKSTFQRSSQKAPRHRVIDDPEKSEGMSAPGMYPKGLSRQKFCTTRELLFTIHNSTDGCKIGE